jgi:hypothetical protein
MLIEIPDITQRKGEPHRRWFTDEFFNLTVWEDPQGTPQLIYDTGPKAHALRKRGKTACSG